MESSNASRREDVGLVDRIKGLGTKFTTNVVGICKKMKKLGQDDPRRIIHSLKVGLALTLVSLFYYSQPLYQSFGVSALWAIMTVVVVFEFSVGATLGKGLNRGLATFMAGALGVGAHHLASITGAIAEPIVLGLFVFLQATTSTFLRFFPTIKARYDYGMLIFILTFALVSVSGFRVDEIIVLAQQRVSTILIGSLVCLIVSIFVCPVWAGEDLHNLVAGNIGKQGNFLEGFGDACFEKGKDGKMENDNNVQLQGYKTALNSKTSEESMANFARYEPPHGRFKFGHPWKQYLKIGALTRQCAYRIDALNAYLTSDFKAPEDFLIKIQDACTTMSTECGKALKELSYSMRSMTIPMETDTHVANATAAAENFKALLKSDIWQDDDDARIGLLDIVPMATLASHLLEIVNCTKKIAESVHELAILASFKGKFDHIESPKKKISNEDPKCTTTSSKVCPDEVVIDVNETAAKDVVVVVPDKL